MAYLSARTLWKTPKLKYPTTRKMKFSIKDFLRKCDQTCGFGLIC